MVDFPVWVEQVGRLVVEPVLDGPDEARKNKDDDTRLAEDQNNTWNQDRAAVGGEWTGLVGEFDGAFAPPAILEKDGFPAMTHQQIWDALKDVNSALINDKANAWRSLTNEARAANQEFLDGVNADLEAGWNGQSGAAAVNGVREFCTSFTSLAASFQLVAHGLDLMEGHLAQAKASVGEPDDVTIGDNLINMLPLDDVLKTPQYRADEAQETARWVMTTYYEPGAADVDSKTPILPEPKKPVDDGGPGGPGQPTGGSPQPSGPGTRPQGTTTTDDGTDTETGASPEGQEQPAGQQDPQTTTPQSTTPQATTPQSTTPSLTTTGTPTTTTPGMPSGAPSGTPSGTPQTTAPFVPGQTVPGSPNNKTTAAPAGTTAATTNSRAGRTGFPGMMSPGARGANRDDEDEHSTPDYLVYDRGSELLGTQPPALPPGGVIGG